MGVNRSSFYKWRNRLKNPSHKLIKRESDMRLFMEYHLKYPSHGYRWLNAKIRFDLGVVYSDNYAQRVCHYCGLKSVSKRFRSYKTAGRECTYPYLLLANMTIKRPFEIIVSDMTIITINEMWYEITFYMDLFNNEIVAYGVSDIRGDRRTYVSGRNQIVDIKKEEYPDYELILHSDQGSVYASKDFNETLPLYNITRSMSRAGTPTDNGVMAG